MRVCRRLSKSGEAHASGRGHPAYPSGPICLHMITILLIVLVLLLIGALPTWPHSSGWGYAPSGGIGTVLLIILVLYLLHVI